ncbi:MAG: MerR family transcriptional regulator [Lachnospiraceae bacterium]|nr:MerR family transcriptional regulator [Lachnospiraceae bacterium]
MDRKYNLNELALMTGFTTRTLRNYLTQGLLNGEKENGAWMFTAKELDRFFSEPFVKEGLRIKRNSVVFDFLAERTKTAGRTCVILDIPGSVEKENDISAFFCGQMRNASDTVFTFESDKGVSRVILSGAADQVEKILKAYYSR